MKYKIEYFGAQGLTELYERKSFFGLKYWSRIDVTYDWVGPKDTWPKETKK